MSSDVDVVRRLFDAVERRDGDELLACYAEDIEITEAAALPYGGTYRGRDGALAHALRFLAAWNPYQGPEELKLDPQFWGDGAGTVCVLFHHRAFDPIRSVRLDALEVSIYQIRDGRVARSQMFHADSAAVAQFLHDARLAAATGVRQDPLPQDDGTG
ncbi:MAG: nuclear transport factor 2 family protein [Mycobacterium sp.]